MATVTSMYTSHNIMVDCISNWYQYARRLRLYYSE